MAAPTLVFTIRCYVHTAHGLAEAPLKRGQQKQRLTSTEKDYFNKTRNTLSIVRPIKPSGRLYCHASIECKRVTRQPNKVSKKIVEPCVCYAS